MNKIVLKPKSQKNLVYTAHLQMKNYTMIIVHLKFMRVLETIFFLYVKIVFLLMQETTRRLRATGKILLSMQLKSLLKIIRKRIF